MRRTRFLDGTMVTARVAKQQGLNRSMIRSVQRGTITISIAGQVQTATITAVVLSNTRLIHLGSTSADGTSTEVPYQSVSLELTNATTITATAGDTSLDAAAVVSYEVIEFWPGVIKSVQRGTIQLVGVASNTATVTAVNTAKSSLECTGFYAATAEPDRFYTKLVLTNGTTITATKNTATDTVNIWYQLVEYY